MSKRFGPMTTTLTAEEFDILISDLVASRIRVAELEALVVKWEADSVKWMRKARELEAQRDAALAIKQRQLLSDDPFDRGYNFAVLLMKETLTTAVGVPSETV